MKKTFLSILFALALCLGLPTAAGAEDPEASGSSSGAAETIFYLWQYDDKIYYCDTEPSDLSSTTGADEISKADNDYPLADKSYKLASDITVDAQFYVTGNVTLDLNGKVLKQTGPYSVIQVGDGTSTNPSSLTLTDSNSTAPYYFDNSNALWTLTTETTGTEAVTGGVITGGNASYGGGVHVNKHSTFTMKGGNIVGCKSVNSSISSISSIGDGGGVYVCGGTFTMEGGRIAGCTAANRGGGVYVDSETNPPTPAQGSFTMTGGTIDHCSAKNGGGVYVSGDATANGTAQGSFTMTGTAKIDHCSATQNGGGVYVVGEAKGTNAAQGTFTMSAGTVSYCSAQNGGGVYVDQYAEFQMIAGTDSTSGTISNCTATGSNGSGGGVYVSGIIKNAAFTMSAGTITGCSAADGGGVYVSGSSTTFTMSGGTITGCSATGTYGSGGGVFVSGGSFNMSGSAEIKSCTAAEYGGGVYVSGSDTTFTMRGGTITGCSAAGGSGGGVRVDNGTFNMTGGTIGGTANGAGNTAKNGGGVYVNDGSFEMTDSAKLLNCTATQNGGGVYVDSSGSFNMRGSAEIQNCTATKNGGGVYFTSSNAINVSELSGSAKLENCTAGGDGGGVYLASDKRFTMSGGTIDGGTAANGGGVYVGSDGSFTMSAGTIKNCKAGGSGGAVYVTGAYGQTGSFTMSGTAVIDGGNGSGTAVNNATSGGGVYVDSHGSFTMSAGTIKNCRATSTGTGGSIKVQGGGVYVDADGSFAMSGTVDRPATITDCTAAASLSPDNCVGGGVYLAGGSFTLSAGNSITNCSTSGHGGGVYVHAGSFTVSGGEINGCKTLPNSDRNGGGGVYVNGSATFTMTAGTIKNCTATGSNGSGGGVYFAGSNTEGVPELSGSAKLENCTAGGAGGGVYVASDKSFTMSGGTIDGGSGSASVTNAEKGGGVYVDTGATFTMTAGTIQNCKAGSSVGMGGGVYVNGTFNMNAGTDTSGTITGCSAPGGSGKGGGVYVNGTFNMNAGTISSCSAKFGGGVYDYHTFTMKAGSISYCSSSETASRGGGVYVCGGQSFTMSGGTIDHCSTVSKGGGVFLDGSDATFTMNAGTDTAGTISNCSVTNGNGGGVFVGNGATFTMNAGSIKNCSATGSNGYGGGVYVTGTSTQKGTFIMSGATITGCSTTGSGGSGGGVYIGTNGTLTMANSTISGCSATPSNGGTGGGIYSNGSVTMEDSAIYGASNEVTPASNASSGGGAYVSTDSTFAMKNCTVSGCNASSGGGVTVNDGTFTMTGSTIENCIAAGSDGGGGVYVNVNCDKFTMSGGKISGCSVTGSDGKGGGIYFAGTHTSGTYELSDQAQVIGCSATGNSGNGGGIYIESGKTFAMTDSTVSGCSVTGSDGKGGGIYNAGTLTMTNSAISGVSNDVTPVPASNARYGGGVYAQSTTTITGCTISGCKVSGDTGSGFGGGLFVASGVTVTMTDSRISGCSASGSGNGSGLGGGVYVTGTFHIKGGSITGCTAVQGGGVYVKVIGKLSVNGAGTAIRENTGSNVYLVKNTGIGAYATIAEEQAGSADGSEIYVTLGATEHANDLRFIGTPDSGNTNSAKGYTWTGSTLSFSESVLAATAALSGNTTILPNGNYVFLDQITDTGTSALTVRGSGALTVLHGLTAGSLTVDGAAVTVQGSLQSSGKSYGVKLTGDSAVLLVKNGGSLTATGGSVSDDTSAASTGVYMGGATATVTVQNGTLTATGGEARANRDGGTATSAGIYLTGTGSSVTLKGGTLTAAGDEVSNKDTCTSCGVYAGTLTLEKGQDAGSFTAKTTANSRNPKKIAVYLTNVTETPAFADNDDMTITTPANGEVVKITGTPDYYTIKNTDTDAVATEVVLAVAGTPAPAPGGGGSSVTTVTVTISSGSGSVTGTATVSDGTAVIAVSDAQIGQVIGSGAGVVTIDLSALKNVTAARIPAKLVEAVSKGENTGLTVVLPTGSVTPDKTALTAAADGKSLTVTVRQVSTAALTQAQKKALGDKVSVRLVFDVEVLLGSTRLTSFNGGRLTVSVPYAPQTGEDTGRLAVRFLRDDGTVEDLGGYYDAARRCFVFATDHLSRFLLVSVEPDSSFSDVADDAYYAAAVDWAVARNITTGIGGGLFGPEATCTRAQVVTFLYRSALARGVDVSVGGDTNILSYTDALEVPEYAMEAFQWACGAGIIQGANGSLMPEADCTRAQIVTMLYRYAAVIGMDVSVGEDTNILSYTDALEVPEYAMEAFQWACGAGVIQGANGSLMPDLTCTRGQIVTMLYRLLNK